MAQERGRTTINQTSLIELDVDPTGNSTSNLDPGDLAFVQGARGLWQKVGTGNSQVVRLDAISTLATQAAANSTLTLTNQSLRTQVFTGSTTGQIVRLPDATTLEIGHSFVFINSSSVPVQLQNSAGTVLQRISPLSRFDVWLSANGTAAGTWNETSAQGTFGSLSTVASSTGNSTNNSQVTYINKVTLSVTGMPLGNYELRWSFKWTAANANRASDIRVQQDGSNLIQAYYFTPNVNEEPFITGALPLSGVTEGNHTYTLDFKVGRSGLFSATTITLSNAYVWLFRRS